MKRQFSCVPKPLKRLFPPRQDKKTQRWRNKGSQSVQHLTCNGTIHIRRIIYWSAEDGADSQIDRWLGIADNSVSVAARELCSRAAIAGGSFRKSAENLERLGQIRVSSNRLREIVEAEGQRALKARDKGLISPAWDASDCKRDGEGRSHVIVGVDGVMVPLVTKSEKDKRRKNRRICGRKKIRRNDRAVGRHRPKANRKRYRGADGPYKEFKIVAFYDRANEHQHAAGTAGNHEVLGRLMRREAAKLKFSRADEKTSASDGAEWIRRQLETKLPMLDEKTLDFYHFSEHIWSVANGCFGQDSGRVADFAAEVLHIAKHDGPTALLARLMEERKRHRSRGKRKSLKEVIQYIARRFDMCDYPKFIARGWPIGSGPTEAFCKTLTRRLKGSGMRWDCPNADGIMALAAMDQSGQWKAYWALQNALVA